jgi:fatty acid desaturase
MMLDNWGHLAAAAMLFFVTAIISAFHTSLQHEVVHGHPTRWPLLNEALVFPSLIIVYPFRRYRQLHLKHHDDANLTDPYEDPESYFWPQSAEQNMSPLMRALLGMNNTFVGRMTLGPLLGLSGFYKTEFVHLRRGEAGVRKAWALHVMSVALVWFWVSWICGIPFWLYMVLVALPGVSWILIRSFAEHQAAKSVGARTAIVEAHVFFSMLFLNNNLHVVHHAHPGVAWYDLPRLYRERKKQYLAANESYLFKGYWQVVRQFAFTKKQPVFHPILHSSFGEAKAESGGPASNK